GEPIEIEASDSLEWPSDQKAYVARGNALVRQGDSQVTAAVITAYYRELPDGGTQIVRVTADGNVVVRTPTETAQGAHGVYDIERDSFILTGGDLRLVTPDETITATESLEYYASDGVAVARGDAVAISGTDELRAQVLTATFTTGPDGGQTLRTIHA